MALQYRTETERVAGQTSHVTSGDPFTPTTEIQRVAETNAKDTDPEQKDGPMTPFDAAEKLRPTFKLEQMPVEDRHHVKFVEDVATELGIEHSSFNLHQVAEALDKANIHPESNEYPKMLYSRQHHANDDVAGASVYDPRHDYVFVSVANEEEASKLGSGWVDNVSELPERGDIPIAADDKPPPAVATGSKPPVVPVESHAEPVV